MIKRCLAIVALLSTLATAQTVVVPKSIPAPGATGMNSSADCGDLRETDARLMLNTDATTYPGKVVGRKALRNIGDNSVSLYGAAGYFLERLGYKQLLGITAGPTTLAGPSRTYTLASDSSVRRVSVSNRYETGVQDSLLSVGPLLGRQTPYSIGKGFGSIFICDGQSSPLRYSALDLKHSTTIESRFPDSEYYRPCLHPLSEPAPGQPLAFLITESGSGASPVRSGKYVYRYRYINSSKTVTGPHGIASAPVYPSQQKVGLCGFESRGFAANTSGGNRTSKVVIERSIGDADFFAIDTINYNEGSEHFFWVDTVSDASGSAAATSYVDSIPAPGQPFAFASVYRVLDTGLQGGFPVADKDSLAVDRTKTYWIAYAFYDPLTGVESPLGPYGSATALWDTVAGVGRYLAFIVGRPDTLLRPKWLHVYRSEGNDSTVLYSYVRVRINRLYPEPVNTENTITKSSIFPGAASDSYLTSGSWNGRSFGATYSTRYTGYNILRGDLGQIITRPPFIQSNPVPFSQLVAVNSRMWGIGDPVYRQRLYYSGFNTPYDWDFFGYVTLDENDNDEAVAIVGSDDMNGLYVFKRNSVYAGAGSDPENDFVIRRISNRHGAVNQKAVCTYGPMVFFLSQDLRAYTLGGQSIDDISGPIADQLATSFGSFANAQLYARVFPGDKCIFFVNRSTEDCFRYDLLSGAWSKNTYKSGYVPVESFDYDTVSTSRGFGQADRWYRLKTGTSLAREVLSATLVDSLTGQSIFQSAYQTPCYGDGVNDFQIQRVVVSGSLSSNAYLKAVVVNEAGDSLCVDSVAASASALRDYSIPLPPHNSKWVSAKITCSTNNQALTINDVTVYCRRVGNVARM